MPGFIRSKRQLRQLFALGRKGELKCGVAKARQMAEEEGHERLSKLPEKVDHKAFGGAVEKGSFAANLARRRKTRRR